MPRQKSVANKSQTKKVNVKELTCLTCGETKKIQDFYTSSSVFHAGTQRVPYCKNCLKDMSTDSNGNINIDKFKSVLKEIDKPYLHDLIQSAFNESKNTDGDIVGIYFKNINSLPQYKSLGWKNSIFEPQLREEQNYSQENEFSYTNFKITNEMIMRWGNKYVEDEIYELEKFYNDMKTSNTIETAQDIAYLKKLSIISLNMDKALMAGNSGEAKQLGDLFSKYMADSKFRAMDKTDADKSGGIRRFCDIFAEVEKDDFIPPWEKYRKINGAKQDIVDKTIMFILNFMLKFNKSDKLVMPPSDTPKIDNDEIDINAKSSFELKDFEEVGVTEEYE